MAGVKFIICIFLISLSIFCAKADVNPIEISRKWFADKGCPREGPIYVECNMCRCSSAHSKHAACTMKECGHPEIKENWENNGKSSCVPGETFYYKCSKCTCDESGKTATCDHRACKYYEARKGLTISRDWFSKHGCPKKGHFNLECNSCRCGKARSQLAVCTLKSCPRVINIDNWVKGVSTCTPGTSFFSQCNHCECDKTGTEPKCDRRACKYY